MIRYPSTVCYHLLGRFTCAAAVRRRCRVPCAAAGFTLLELLVVVAIIGLLAAYVGPKYFSQVSKTEHGVAKAQIEAFARALDTYRLDVGQYPTTEEGLNALLTRPNNVAKWNGPYLQKMVPLDPWGRPYTYRAPGVAGDFDIISLGKDGQPGGTGDAADVTNQ
ncbi:type II secretion system major pseudopilin GspG [Propionivibrio sp.]|uniref:type II secretion system major pseudopilin GspG n=1 Tax=Propionivibrio sp. TaxID=2212460 RepID=UPI003BF0AC59